MCRQRFTLHLPDVLQRRARCFGMLGIVAPYDYTLPAVPSFGGKAVLSSAASADQPRRSIVELTVKVWGDEVTAVHEKQGHTYRFAVSQGDLVELGCLRIEANPRASRSDSPACASSCHLRA
jgi:hypothetical protein